MSHVFQSWMAPNAHYASLVILPVTVGVNVYNFDEWMNLSRHKRFS